MTTLVLAAIAAVTEPEVRLADLQAFPAQEVAGSFASLAWQHQVFMDHQRAFHPEDPARYQRFYEESCIAEQAWRMLQSAYWCHDHWPNDALDRLRELRDLIGYPAYYSGRMPSPIPLHHLEIQ